MCGVAGMIFEQSSRDIAQSLYTNLYHLSHRGQDSAGMVIERPDGTYKAHTKPGTIDRAFLDLDLRAPEWHGFVGIAHTRYSTSGVDFQNPRSVEEAERAAQPLEGSFRGKPFFISYNGNLTPAYIKELYEALHRRGYKEDLFQRESWVDTELIIKLIESSHEETFKDALLKDVCPQLRGAFSMILLYDGALYGVRDANGFRPLELGQIQDGYIISSEDNIFDGGKLPGTKKIRSIEPGECVICRRAGEEISITSVRWQEPHPTYCAFERVYFSRFDSSLGGDRIALQRAALGRVLAREHPPPAHAHMVIGVPDSGVDAGYGYALESKLRYEGRALRRLHGAGRTFIEPVNDLRKRGAEFKLVVIPELVEDKVMVVVDDSIVRGNVAPRVVYILKEAGAKEVHLRVSSPPIRHGCWYGIDTWRIEDELIAKDVSDVGKIRQMINSYVLREYGVQFTLDSLGYLSLEGMKSVWKGREGLCDACWTGNYPVI